MTIQKQMKAQLENAGLPFREVKCYGSQIVVTSLSRDAANKWALLLAKLATVRGITESVDYAQRNTNTVLHPSTVRVWRTFARV